ncbi:MAG: serine hydrolase domain-containing protein [Chloroflexota bacterium]
MKKNLTHLGIEAARLERIDQLLMRYINSGKMAGMVTLVARKGEIAYLKSHGMADVASQTPMRDDTIFRIFSMTKPVTGAALMICLEEGWFNPVDLVKTYIPAFSNMEVMTDPDGTLAPAKRDITVQDLYRHTSGLTYGGLHGAHPVSKLYAEAGIGASSDSNADFVEKLAALPLRFQPGSRWHYSMGMDVLARLIEIWSGQSYGEFLAERIFQPLGMVDSGFYFDPQKQARLATLYQVAENDSIKAVPDQIIEYDESNRFESGGGGLLSTIMDYYRFCQCLLNGGEYNGQRILGRKTVEFMRSNALTPDQMPVAFEGLEPFAGFGYGVCVKVMQDPAAGGWQGSPGDFGWGGYAETYHFIDPVEELIGINMIQCAPSMTYPIRKEFRMAVYQALV